MIKNIYLQRFADGNTNLNDKKEVDTKVDTKPEEVKPITNTIRSIFGLKDKSTKAEPAKETDKKTDETKKLDEAKEAGEKPETKKPDEAKEPNTTGDKADKAEPEFYEIPYQKDKDGNQLKVKIPVTERDAYLQKGMNYDKVKTDADNAKATLKRIAQAEGFKTVDEYLAELGNREKAKLAEQVEEAAGDPDKINEIVQNHPVVLQTKEERRKLDYLNAKTELSKDEFYKKLEPELDRLMEQNQTADPNLVYSVIVGNYVRSAEYKQELAAEKERTAKEKESAKESAEKKVIADMHDKERRSTPAGGDTGEGKDIVQPTDFTKKLAEIFGVNASKVAQRAHEKMKRS